MTNFLFSAAAKRPVHSVKHTLYGSDTALFVQGDRVWTSDVLRPREPESVSVHPALKDSAVDNINSQILAKGPDFLMAFSVEEPALYKVVGNWVSRNNRLVSGQVKQQTYSAIVAGVSFILGETVKNRTSWQCSFKLSWCSMMWLKSSVVHWGAPGCVLEIWEPYNSLLLRSLHTYTVYIYICFLSICLPPFICLMMLW